MELGVKKGLVIDENFVNFVKNLVIVNQQQNFSCYLLLEVSRKGIVIIEIGVDFIVLYLVLEAKIFDDMLKVNYFNDLLCKIVLVVH